MLRSSSITIILHRFIQGIHLPQDVRVPQVSGQYSGLEVRPMAIPLLHGRQPPPQERHFEISIQPLLRCERQYEDLTTILLLIGRIQPQINILHGRGESSYLQEIRKMYDFTMVWIAMSLGPMPMMWDISRVLEGRRYEFLIMPQMSYQPFDISLVRPGQHIRRMGIIR